MFETSVVREAAAVAPKRVGVMTVSIAIHTLLVVGAIAVSVASVAFPKNAPNQLRLFQVAEPVGVPPALGNPNGGARPQPKPAAQLTPKPQMPDQPTAPLAVPDEAPIADSSATADTSSNTGDGAGTSTDPLGRPDGVPDGIGTGTPGRGIGTPAAETPVEDKVYVVGGEVRAPRVVRRTDPIYPQAFIRVGASATVTVRFIIGTDGRVKEAIITRSSFAPFNQSVIDAVSQWTFQPATLRGQPVTAQYELTVRFSATR